MSLVYSEGPYRNDLYTGVTTRQTLLTNIDTSLRASGWTSENVFAFTSGIWTGQPVAAQTITLGPTTYTFRAAVGATANEVLIGANASATYANLKAACNLEAGAGTLYGSATVLNPTVTAAFYLPTSISAGTIRFQSKINSTPFGQQSVISFSRTAANFNFNQNQNQYAGYIWTCPATPITGQRMRIYGIDGLETVGGPANYIRLYPRDAEELYPIIPWPNFGDPNNTTTGFRLAAARYTSWRIICSRYSVLIYADGAGAPTGSQSAFYAAVPYVYPFLAPVVVANASNTSPITITTGTSHGYITGDNVFLQGVGGNLAANGIFSCTVTSPTTYTIPVAGTGAYTSGGVCCKSTNDKVGLVILSNADDNIGFQFPMNQLTTSTSNCYQLLNGVAFSNSGGSAVGNASIAVSAPARTDDANAALRFVDGTTVIGEPHLLISGTTGGKALWCGQLYDTFVSMDVNTIGTTAVVDGRNWWCVGTCAGTTAFSRGSVWMVVP